MNKTNIIFFIQRANFPYSCATIFCRASLVAVLALSTGTAFAGGVPTLDTIVITGERDGLVGVASSSSEGTVTAQQLENRPLLRPAEVLEVVPGLIISQHSGDGKANQYYLRGFNLDHGTDFATTLMGMPVNLPTHAHGQGYSDLQFLIPELVERMQYRKGTYAADVGDFATAGSARIEYFHKLDAPFADATVGERGYRRALLAGSPEAAGGNLLYALEWTANNGPWENPEAIGKFNGLLRYSEGTRNAGWSVAAIAYKAQWDSTDRVPQRAIDNGLISHYGTLDPSDGGETHRYSFSGEWSARADNRWSRANAYLVDYDLKLWSNFTFCLNDIALHGNCNLGDQFLQADQRKIYGMNAAQTWYGEWDGRASELTLGLQSRLDRIANVGLYTTTARQIWGTVRADKVDEGSVSIYAESQVQWHEKFRSIAGLREDLYRFDVNSNLAQNSGRVDASIASPKLALIFGPWAKTEYYFNIGYGFHSYDARGTTIKVNPDFRDPGYFGAVAPVTPLVRAKGYEAGLRHALSSALQTSLALWRLDLASELLFVGDAGTTESSFPSQRHGVEWANFWTPGAGITIDATVPGDYIPGAIEKTASVGITYDEQSSWSGGLRLRYFGPRPLIEDNSVRSQGSTMVNLHVGYRLGKETKLALDILNLFDAKVSDIDYYYTSQLRGEAAPVDDIHTHPSEPRTMRMTLRYQF